MNFARKLFFLISLCAIFFSSCKKDELLTDPLAKIQFSKDTILFDTVFTQVGSVTKSFRIYNKHKQPLNISKIYLATGANSQYRVNVDGFYTSPSNPVIKDVEILGGDSLYVFVQVTVDPTGSNAPLLIKDSIIFETNGNVQDVKLVAIGQDVYLHKPDHFPTSGFPAYSIISCNDVWTNDKPHLIFGYAFVDSACNLTMQQGTRVHLYKNAVLAVYKGTLIINGTKNNEVTIQGSRLEPDYKDAPGQWGKIWLMAGSKNNIINYAIIKNGAIGLQVDTVVTTGTPTLKLSNTIIKNMKAAALYGQGAHIWSNNCVFANCGQYVAALSIGGKYKFEHCTFANFWSEDNRQTPLLALNNYYVSGSTLFVRPMDSCYFGNCILYGKIADEIGIDSTTAVGSGFYMKYTFNHCILKTTLNTSNTVFYNTVLKNQSPVFENTSTNDYRIQASSPARDAGDTFISIPFDLNGNLRSGIPDIGAYEYAP
jgi:hypothetical protein